MENYTETLRSEIINLLDAVSAEGITKVNTRALLADLKSQGFSIDMINLLEVIDDIVIVSSADEDTIEISTSDAEQKSIVDDLPGDDTGDEALELDDEPVTIDQDRVGRLAQKKALNDIRGG